MPPASRAAQVVRLPLRFPVAFSLLIALVQRSEKRQDRRVIPRAELAIAHVWCRMTHVMRPGVLHAIRC